MFYIFLTVCYALQVFASGYLRTIILDDHFPCFGKNPAFTKSVGNELWVLLLEKVWAKVNDNYENIEAGNCVEAFTFLSGAPCEYIHHETHELGREGIWQKILFGDYCNYIMTSSAVRVTGISCEEYDHVGIIPNHAYSLLSAVEVLHQDQTLQLLQLRNPWGRQNFVGRWSDVSPLWTPELRKKVNADNKDEGTFFMCFEDYMRYFSRTTICKYHDDYFSTTFEVNQKLGDYTLLAFHVESLLTGFITIHQYHQRFIREEKKDYTYSNFTILLAQVFPNENLQCIGNGPTLTKDKSEHILELTLNPGDYILYIKAEWNQPYITEYIVNAYSSEKLSFFNVEFKEESKLIAEIMKNYCWQYRKNFKSFSPYPMLKEERGILRSQGLAYEYYYNSLDFGPVGAVLIESTPLVKNMTKIYPNCPTPISFMLLPGKDAIILYRVGSRPYSFSFKNSYKLIRHYKDGGGDSILFRILLITLKLCKIVLYLFNYYIV